MTFFIIILTNELQAAYTSEGPRTRVCEGGVIDTVMKACVSDAKGFT